MPDPEQRSPEPAPTAAAKPGFLERQRRRARLRKQLAVREQLLLELGAIVYELHRQGQRAPELLQARAAQLDEIDAEVRALEAGLDDGALAPAWQDDRWEGEHAGAWPAEEHGTGEWTTDEGAHDWEAEDEDGEWAPEDEWDDEDPDEALDETQEWSAADLHDALGSSNGSADAETEAKRDEDGR